ncbi:porin [Telluria mixta]|uniref:Porin n=1 Tax=Telluria mixta TaxID=34071 RepID=A0ABT2BVL7_9BURK|nr:porin [Telluria mixta]MCS0629175.1 porin [Telluria mixta]WEM97616.1 porin [Telluria mixta]
MKKTLVAAALLGAFAGVAQAQTAVQIYGNVDVGMVKRTDNTLAIGKRAANTLGFKGTEDLGNGLKALFQIEMRYEPDTGTTENNGRPLFQGQSRVGLQGDFGMIRLGRGLTPFQEIVGSFEPWHGLPSPAGFYTDISVAGFNSAPLDVGGSGPNNNRISNAIFYNSPVANGFQVNASWASKEANGGGVAGVGAGATTYATGAQASANPFSIAGTYNNGPAAAMLAYERNAVESKVWSVAGSFSVTPELKLMGTYSHQNMEHINTQRPTIKGAEIGATYAVGPGKVLAGFGLKKQEENVRLHDLITRQYSLGYEYSLSKRTYLYVDASRKTHIRNQTTGAPAATPTVNHYDVGLNHSF